MESGRFRALMLLLALLLLGGVGAWWFLASEEDELPPAPELIGSGEREGRGEEERDGRETIVSDPYSGEKAPGSDEDDLAVAGDFPVRIFLPGKRPAVGAKVEVHAHDGPGLLNLFSRFELDALPGGAPRLELVADENGEVDIGPAGVGSRILVARLREFSGIGHLTVHEPGSEAAKQAAKWRGTSNAPWVMLGAARVVEVVATGPDGAGVPRIPVTILSPEKGRMAPSMFSGPADNVHSLGTALTDDEGRARFMVTRHGDRGLFDAKQVRGLAVLHGRKWVDALAPFEGSSARIEIPLPDLLDLEFRVTRPEGNEHPVKVSWCKGPKVDWPEYMHVNWAGLQYLGGDGPLEILTSSWITSFLGSSGRAGGFVPGETMSFRVSLWGHEDRDVTETLEMHAGTQVLDLEIGRALPQVSLRLVDEEGRPRDASRFFLNTVQANDHRRAARQRKVEGKDELSAWLPIDSALTLEIHARQGSGLGPNGRSKAVATRKIPALESGASRDLGAIVVSRFPLLVAGRIVDAEGVGLPGVNVSVMGRAPRSPGSFRTRFVSSSSTSGEGGRFEIRAVAQSSMDYTAEVTGPYRSAKVTFEPGEAELVIEAETAGSLAGRLDLADEAMLGATRLHLLAPHFRHPQRVSLKEGGWFEALLLRPATYELVVLIGTSTDGLEARRVSGIVVRSGEPTRPDVLQGLRVGDDFQRAEVTVLGPDDRPYPGASVTWSGRYGDVPFMEMEQTGASGKVSLWLPADFEAKVSVSPGGDIWQAEKQDGPGMMHRVVEKARHPLTVRLRPYPRLALMLEPGLPTVAGFEKWRVSLARRRSAERLRELEFHRKKSRYPNRPVMPFSTIQHLDATPGQTELAFDRPAYGALCLVLWRPDGRTGVTLGRFHFAEGSDDATIPVALDAAVLEEVKTWTR